MQPVPLQALGFRDAEADQEHEAHGGERHWVLAVLFGNTHGLPEFLDFNDAETPLLLLPGKFADAVCRVGGDHIKALGVGENSARSTRCVPPHRYRPW